MSRWDRVSDAVERFARDEGLRIVLAVLGTVVAVRLVRIVLARVRARVESSALTQRGAAADPGRLQAFFDVLNYLGVALVVIVGSMAFLSVLGVNTGALLASAGVLGFALGFGAQNMVKDLLNGLFLLAEGQYTIGDRITIGNATGTVERVTLRTTTLRDSNGDVHIVASGDIRVVTNKTKGYSRVVLDVGFPHQLPVEQAFALLTGVGAEAAADPDVAPHLIEAPTVVGIEAIQEHQLLLRLSAKVTAARNQAVARRLRYLVAAMFEREGLEVPSSGK